MASTIRPWSARRRSWGTTAVRHLVGQGVLERVLEVRDEPRSRRGTRRPAGSRARAAARPRGASAMARRRAKGTSLPMTDGRLEQSLGLGREAVDAGGQDGLHRGRHLDRVDRSGQGVRASFAAQGLGLHQRLHGLLEEERIPLGPLDEERREPLEPGVFAEEAPKELLRALRRQRVEAELGVGRLAAPGVLILGTVVDQEAEPGRPEALDQAVERPPASRRRPSGDLRPRGAGAGPGPRGARAA